MGFHEEAFEGAIEIVSAAMEEAELKINAESGEKVGDFFAAIYNRLRAIANDEDDASEEIEDEEDAEEEDSEIEDEEDAEEEDSEDEDAEEDSEDEDEEDAEEDSEDEEDENAEDEDSEDEEESEETDTEKRSGIFEVFIDATGNYRFNLKAANNQIIAVSQGYKSREACLKGIASVQRSSEKAVIRESE